MGKKNEPPATPAAPSSEMRVDGTPIYRQWMEGSNTITDVYKTPFEKQQEQFFQSQLPQVENKLFSPNESYFKEIADKRKQLAMKGFNEDKENILRSLAEDSNQRFGSLSNSPYRDNLTEASKVFADELNDINTQYDADYQNPRANEYNYLKGLFDIANGLQTEQLGNMYAGLGQLGNQFGQGSTWLNNIYNTQAGIYNAQTQADAYKQAALWNALSNAASGIGQGARTAGGRGKLFAL